jgi:hypothetical protein
MRRVALIVVLGALLLCPAAARAQEGAAIFLGGAAVALGAHEAGHLLFGVAFDARPLAFNILASVAYAGAAAAKAGPVERDTRAIGDALDIDERWVSLMVLAPAVLDAYRYFHPDARWAAWGSRGLKVGWVMVILK